MLGQLWVARHLQICKKSCISTNTVCCNRPNWFTPESTPKCCCPLFICSPTYILLHSYHPILKSDLVGGILGVEPVCSQRSLLAILPPSGVELEKEKPSMYAWEENWVLGCRRPWKLTGGQGAWGIPLQLAPSSSPPSEARAPNCLMAELTLAAWPISGWCFLCVKAITFKLFSVCHCNILNWGHIWIYSDTWKKDQNLSKCFWESSCHEQYWNLIRHLYNCPFGSIWICYDLLQRQMISIAL